MASINDVRSVNNPQRNYEWEVEVLGSSVAGTLPLLTLRAETVTIPQTSVETIEINYKGQKTFHSGRDASSHTISCTFWDSEANDVYNYFKNWMENGLSNSVSGGGTTRDQYAAELLIKLMAADSESITQTNRLTNVFPTEIGDVSLDYSGSEHKKVEVTFSYDTNLPE